jgi:fatty acid desaturase
MFQVMPLLSREKYVKALRPEMPKGTLDRAPSRLAFVPVHLAIITISMLAIALGWVPWFVFPLLSLVIGASLAGNTFVTHELLHGGIVRNKHIQYAIGWLGFLPFVVSPRLWIAWHNTDHHARANFVDDPDAYPTLEQYHSMRGARFAADHFALGGRRWRGVLSLLFGFTGQSGAVLVTARSRGFLNASEHRRAIAETALGIATWTVIGILIGPVPFVFACLLPMLVANTCVMAFILTNHGLNPRVAINDPLASGLTVTVPRFVEWLTLGFGFHVEHHLFPAMSARHAPAIRTLLQKNWPERYHSMPLGEALQRLHRTARVYKSDTELFDPRTGEHHPTLSVGYPLAGTENESIEA